MTRAPKRFPPKAISFVALAGFNGADATTCISTSAPLDLSTDYFPASNRIAVDGTPAGSAEVTVAGDFSVTYHTYFKVLKNLKTSNTYILRMCGSEKPTEYPNGTAIETDAAHFSVPINGVAVGWSTPVPFFEQLDLMDKVKLADPTYVHSPCLQKAEEDGAIAVGDYSSFGDEAKNATDVELVMAGSAGPYGYGCQCAKDVIFGAPQDDTPLGRAEWIKYISVFFNEEDRANLIFSREKDAYEATKELAERAAATHESANGGKKKCAWISETDYNYDTYIYDSWKIDSDAYKLKYCTDAGMEAVAGESGITYAKGTDELKTALADVDVIIDQSFWASKSYDTKAKVFTELGFAESDLKTGAILLRTDKEISADKNVAWLESGVLRPAHVLQGLVHAVWPGTVAEIPDACFDYFREITGLTIEAVNVKSHTACAAWESANQEAQCVTNIISDDEMYLIRDSPAAKPSSIIAIVIALIIAVVGA